MKKNKRILIKSSMSIGLISSIIPISYFINTNELNEPNNITSSVINSEELNKQDSKIYFGEQYKSIYYNNLTKPVISPNPNLPGFLGYVQPPSGINNNTFPTEIVWTSPNLFSSWSAKLIDHPSAKLMKPTELSDKPILLSAIHSDTFNQTTPFKNQIFAIVGLGKVDNSGEPAYNAKQHWIFRYDVATGAPIIDSREPILPALQHTSWTNNLKSNIGNISIIHDLKNNKYIAYYPGELRYIKDEMYAFSIDDNNQLSIQPNSVAAGGKFTWTTYISEGNARERNNYFSNNNILLGLQSVSSNDGNNLVMIVHSAGAEDNPNSIRAIELESNLAIIRGWNFNPNIVAKGRVVGNNDYIDSTTRNIIISPDRLKKEWIIPNISINGDGLYRINFMILAENKVVPSLFTYLNIGFAKSGKSFRMLSNVYPITPGVANPNPPLSYGEIYRGIIPSGREAPFIWYNPNIPNEVITTTISSATLNNVESVKIRMDNEPVSSNDIKYIISLGTFNVGSGVNSIARSSTIEWPFSKDYYFSSMANNRTINSHINTAGGITTLNDIQNNGGYSIVNPQIAAEDLGWLAGGAKEMAATEVKDSDIINIKNPGNTNSANDSFIKFPLSASSGTRLTITAEIVGTVFKDAANGIISGRVKLNSHQVNGPINTSFIGYIDFKVEGFKPISAATTNPEISSDISNIIPSFLSSNVDEINNYFSVANLPKDTNLTWEISEVNNKEGKAKISATVDRYYPGGTGSITYESKTFVSEITDFGKMTGTTIEAIIDNLEINESKNLITVWEVDDKNVSSFLKVNDLVPNAESTFEYTVRNQLPKIGTITVDVVISGGYFDPDNLGLPNISPDKKLTLAVNITGFKKVTGRTTIAALEGNREISPTLLSEEDLINYINIHNPVPGYVPTINEIKANDTLGSIEFNLSLDLAYADDGTISRDPASQFNKYSNIKIDNFKTGIANKDSLIMSRNNNIISEQMLPYQVDKDNINLFVAIINKPIGINVNIEYEFTEQNNIDSNTQNGGSLIVTARIQPHLDNNGNLNNGVKVSSIKLTGFKAISSHTELKPIEGKFNSYPQYILEQNINDFYALSNGSDVFGKQTEIILEKDTYKFDNLNGVIRLNYKLKNYFAPTGFFINRESEVRGLVISGFNKLSGFTTLELINPNIVEKISAEDFDVSLTDYEQYFKIKNSLDQTKLRSITKTSFNNSKGSAIFALEFSDGSIDSNYTMVEGSRINVEILGFEMVPEDNSTLYAIIGGSIGGVVLLAIIIGVIIYMMNNNKNKKPTNKNSKSKGGPPSGPTPTQVATPSLTRPIPPSVPPLTPPPVRPFNK